MRNDVSFPPDPNAPGDDDDRPAATTPAARRAAAAAAARANGRGATHARPFSPNQPPGPTHPHAPDRAHSLEKTRDRPATGMLYETPEDRGGIDSTRLSIIVISIVAIALVVVLWLFFRGAGTAVTPQPAGATPNATIIDDPAADRNPK